MEEIADLRAGNPAWRKPISKPLVTSLAFGASKEAVTALLRKPNKKPLRKSAGISIEKLFREIKAEIDQEEYSVEDVGGYDD
jgi:hypothetical protein